MQLKMLLSVAFAARAHCLCIFSFVAHQDSQLILCKATFCLVSPQHVLVHTVIPPCVQNFAFPLNSMRCLFLLPAEVFLNGSKPPCV